MATLPPLTPDEIAADRGPRIIAGNLVVAIIATIAVGLRFLARTVKSGTYGVDDWLILAALPFGWGMAIATIISVQHGLGRHLIVMEELYPEKLITEGKVCTVFLEISMSPSTNCLRISKYGVYNH